MNSVVERTFHGSTQKGGTKGGTSKLEPIMYKLAHKLLWQFGYLGGLFKYLGYDNQMNIEYGKVKRMPRPKDVNEKDVRAFADSIMDFTSMDTVEDEPTNDAGLVLCEDVIEMDTVEEEYNDSDESVGCDNEWY